MEEKKKEYEKPTIEILEFSIEESIALSGLSDPGVICSDDYM